MMKYTLASLTLLTVAPLSAQPSPQVSQAPEYESPLDRIPNIPLIPSIPDSIEITGANSIEYSAENNTLLYSSDSQIHLKTDTGSEITAQSAKADLTNKSILLQGDVSVYQGPSLLRGNEVTYFWENNNIDASNIRIKASDVMVKAQKVHSTTIKGQTAYICENAGITLQDIDTPDSWLKAQKITLYPEDSVAFENIYFTLYDYPILYLPYFAHSLNPKLGYLPTPGTRTIWGAFLKNQYGFVLGNTYIKNGIPTGNYIATARLDYRTRRGIATGLDIVHESHLRKYPDFKGLTLYFADDTDPNIKLEGIPRNQVNSNRWVARLQERLNLTPETSTSPSNEWESHIDININLLSDAHVLEDFFPQEVTKNQTPENAVILSAHKGHHIFTGLTQFAPNDFYWAEERLPQISWDRIHSPIGNSTINYEGSAQFAIIDQYLPSSEKSYYENVLKLFSPTDDYYRLLKAKYSTSPYSRLYTYHEFSHPINTSKYLTITPKLGGAYTGYYNSEEDSNYNRGTFYTGVDFIGKFSGDFSDIKQYDIGINGLTHVVSPYVTYSFLSTNHQDPYILSIDDQVLTTNPQALNLGRYSAIDGISSWNIVRTGLKNYFLTSQDKKEKEWFTWDIFMDSYLSEVNSADRFSNTYSTTSWNPFPWIKLQTQNQFPLIGDGSGYQEHNFVTTFMPTNYLEFYVGNRNLIGHPILEDSNYLTSGIYIRFSKNTTFSARYRWELNDSTLETQEYTFYRNLGSWVIGVGYYCNYNRIQYDQGVLLRFTLKNYPGVDMPVKM